jgi:hypothetical protein
MRSETQSRAARMAASAALAQQWPALSRARRLGCDYAICGGQQEARLPAGGRHSEWLAIAIIGGCKRNTRWLPLADKSIPKLAACARRPEAAETIDHHLHGEVRRCLTITAPLAAPTRQASTLPEESLDCNAQ